MLGRIAMDHPCVFATADVDFYGEPENPCRTRREALERYALYLETRFPARCGDDDPRVTTIHCGIQPATKTRVCPICEQGDTVDPNPRRKLSGALMGRVYKPINGVFYKLPCSKRFRLALDEAAQKYRDCGPAFGIRRAMTMVPPDLLDREFQNIYI